MAVAASSVTIAGFSPNASAYNFCSKLWARAYTQEEVTHQAWPREAHRLQHTNISESGRPVGPNDLPCLSRTWMFCERLIARRGLPQEARHVQTISLSSDRHRRVEHQHMAPIKYGMPHRATQCISRTEHPL